MVAACSGESESEFGEMPLPSPEPLKQRSGKINKQVRQVEACLGKRGDVAIENIGDIIEVRLDFDTYVEVIDDGPTGSDGLVQIRAEELRNNNIAFNRAGNTFAFGGAEAEMCL